MHPEKRQHPGSTAPSVTTIGGRLLTYGLATADVDGARGFHDEVFLPRAFEHCISHGQDLEAKVTLPGAPPVVLMFRRGEGTLRLKEEIDGVSYRLEVPPGDWGEALLAAAAGGGLRVAFTFVVGPGGDKWEEGEKLGGAPARYREIRQATITGLELTA